MLSRFQFDAASVVIEFLIRRLATIVFDVCEIIGYSVSVLLVGVFYALVMNEKNTNIFKSMNAVSLDVVDFSKLPQAHRNAILKNGFMTVWWRNVSMFSFLPSFRSILMYNPFLFLAQVFFTNQFTVDLPPEEQTTENFELIEKLLHKFTGKMKESKELDAVNFNPNFIETDIDDGLFNDIGLQHYSLFTSYIQMEYPKYKAGPLIFDYASPIIEDGTKRKKLDRLWASSGNPFYAIIAYVELTITKNGRLEHPMMGIFSDSLCSNYTWNNIDTLFSSKAGPYIQDQYQKWKAIPIEIISNIEE